MLGSHDWFEALIARRTLAFRDQAAQNHDLGFHVQTLLSDGVPHLPFEGSNLVQELVVNDWQVTALVRQGSNLKMLKNMPVELFPEAYTLGLDVAERVGVAYSMGCRVVGVNHSMMFFYAYAFNRADPDDVDRAQRALEETNQRVVALGGVPWKAEAPAQQEIIDRMDPAMFAMMGRIRLVLDPNGIMNPGNWEKRG